MAKKIFGWLLTIHGFFGFLLSLILALNEEARSMFPSELLNGLIPTSFAMLVFGITLLKKRYWMPNEKMSFKKVLIVATIGLIGFILTVTISAIITYIVFVDKSEYFSIVFLIVFVFVIIFLPEPDKIEKLFKKNKTIKETEDKSLSNQIEQITVQVSDSNEIGEPVNIQSKSMNKPNINKEINFIEKFDNVNIETENTENTETQTENLHNNIKMTTETNNNKNQVSDKKIEIKRSFNNFLRSNKFTKRFFELHTGMKRLLISVGVIIGIILAIATIGVDTYDILEFLISLILIVLIFLIFCVFYLVLIRVILWIYDGFTEKK